jgi:hypothetical protein
MTRWQDNWGEATSLRPPGDGLGIYFKEQRNFARAQHALSVRQPRHWHLPVSWVTLPPFAEQRTHPAPVFFAQIGFFGTKNTIFCPQRV